MNAVKRKFILDCDSGTDDAQALMMVLAQPDIELLAVMTVFGNANCDKTSRNCLRILKFKNRLDIPVYKGSDKGLIGDIPFTSNYHGYDGLGDIHIEGVDPIDIDLIQKEHAAVALVRLVNENPNQITLVATGPLTNIALALHLDPQFGTKLHDIYVMGGNTEGQGNVTPSAEFNFYTDPEAAYFVLNSIGKMINLCSMEVCERHGFSWEWYEKFTDGKTRSSCLVRDFEHSLITREKQKGIAKSYIMVWDQLTMASAIKKDLLIQSVNVYATVELHGMHTRGQLIVDWKKKQNKHQPNVRLLQQFNQAMFDSLIHMVTKD